MTRRSVVWRAGRRLLPLSLGIVMARSVFAQRVHGTVRDSASAQPVLGVVLTLLDSAGRVSTRTISDEKGRYSLPLGASSARLRAIRIGFQPRELRLPRAGAEDATLDVTMAAIPAMLTSVKVSGRPLCPGSGDQGLAFSLWEQARAGLLASVVARDANPADVRTLVYTRTLGTNDNRVRGQLSQRREGVSTRPFVAVAEPDVFARSGYMKEEATGRTYYAPDADVLLHESFAVTHCFSLTIDRDHPAQVGIAFEPAAGRGRDTLVDVEGVLWLDRDHPQLRTLEFGYTGLEPIAETVRTGGTLSFRSMPNGVVLIDWWSLRLPILEPAPRPSNVRPMNVPVSERRKDRTGLRVAEVHESGGELLVAAWRDGTKIAIEPGRIVGRVVEKASSRPHAGAIVRLVGTYDQTLTDSTGAFALTPVVPGRYTLSATDSAFGGFVEERSATRNVEVARGRQAEVQVELPSLASVLGRLCAGEPMPRGTSILVGQLTDSAGAPLHDARLSAIWLGDVRVVPGALMTRSEEREIALDRSGHFRLCGVALERPIKLAVTIGDVRADTTVFVHDSSFARVIWRVSPHGRGNAVGSVFGSGPGRYSRQRSPLAPLPSRGGNELTLANSLRRLPGG